MKLFELIELFSFVGAESRVDDGGSLRTAARRPSASMEAPERTAAREFLAAESQRLAQEAQARLQAENAQARARLTARWRRRSGREAIRSDQRVIFFKN